MRWCQPGRGPAARTTSEVHSHVGGERAARDPWAVGMARSVHETEVRHGLMGLGGIGLVMTIELVAMAL